MKKAIIALSITCVALLVMFLTKPTPEVVNAYQTDEGIMIEYENNTGYWYEFA